ncbi:uncharacterized protein Z518_05798 [Rhinocladiella mackenziei CBS 650.93]|uniref:Phosphatidylinositol-specific phospholipase C X domain-containing protein n=1 Tax=Rhinocladiella mackenziei CBS 650.93 TaxID=1442369 RepID=A0A0D2FRZ8_9EURO|nr:uncharacterized protein Z518_05798 [Rhinocladiella mackenziei CBS 650.93]KIX04927.1 hypothetical protein Z518_05798 [Rhinocladiella mackenziei CBS 650.93]
MNLLSSLKGQQKSSLTGEGGTLLLINGTAYTWKKGNSNSYQMTTWSFPKEVQPGDIASVYIQFKQTIGTVRSDTSGFCNYALKGTQARSFRIEVKDAPSNLKVQLQNIQTPNNPKGSWIQLGWRHDGVVSFILSGKEGSFSSSNPPHDWMQQNLRTLGPRPLHKICMPGTHDAGMGEITHTDVIPADIMADFAQTQSLTIIGQLEMGSRYFDIRPEISGGENWTGHYTGKLGARGQKMSSIIDDINTFTQKCAELIILNLSHSLQTDQGWREYDQAEWNALFAELIRLNYRFILTGSEAKDLSLLPLSRFIGSGHAAVVIVVEAPSHINLSAYGDKGFYLPSQLNVYNEYSNTNDCVEMVQDQVQKMENFMKSSDKRLFLISWTLTQQPPDVTPEDFLPPNTLVGLGKIAQWKIDNKTIRILAYSANKALLTDLLPHVSQAAFPNIVYIDYMEIKDYVALAMAINDRAFTNA